MNEVVTKEDIKIENMIYEIRGKQVMLDSDLARLYKCKNGTKTINLAVKRHINRFPERFMFQLTKDEYDYLRFQNETAKENNMSRTLPYVFTEQGVAMLAAILRTPVAEEISIQIMDAFVAMRKYISTNLLEQKYINNMVLEHDFQIKLLKDSFQKIEEKKKVNEIYFNGQKIAELHLNGDGQKVKLPNALIRSEQVNEITIKSGRNMMQTAYIDYDDIEFMNLSIQSE